MGGILWLPCCMLLSKIREVSLRPEVWLSFLFLIPLRLMSKPGIGCLWSSADVAPMLVLRALLKVARGFSIPLNAPRECLVANKNGCVVLRFSKKFCCVLVGDWRTDLLREVKFDLAVLLKSVGQKFLLSGMCTSVYCSARSLRACCFIPFMTSFDLPREVL